jgi:hypothetical protein
MGDIGSENWLEFVAAEDFGVFEKLIALRIHAPRLLLKTGGLAILSTSTPLACWKTGA